MVRKMRRTINLRAVQSQFDFSMKLIMEDQNNKHYIERQSEEDMLDLRAGVASKFFGLKLNHHRYLPSCN